MKRVLLLAAVAVVFGVAGIFFGHMLALSNQPAIVARNLTRVTIPQVKIETDIGESHVIAELPSHQSRRIQLLGRDKSLWIVAKLADGTELTSEKTYVTSQGMCLSRFPKMQSSWTMSCDRSNQTMKPTAPFRNKFSVFAATPCCGLSFSR